MSLEGSHDQLSLLPSAGRCLMHYMASLIHQSVPLRSCLLTGTFGIVERFHRHMKSALRARLTSPNWLDELPWVLLGIRTAPKDDLHCSSAELVFGSTLTVPGDFVATPHGQQDAATVLPQLRETVRKFVPTPTTRHGHSRTSVPPDLQSSQYVFVRRDAHRTSLQRPYNGPFQVLESGPKFFKIDFGGKPDTVSVDRLKPAHLALDQPVQVGPN